MHVRRLVMPTCPLEKAYFVYYLTRTACSTYAGPPKKRRSRRQAQPAGRATRNSFEGLHVARLKVPKGGKYLIQYAAATLLNARPERQRTMIDRATVSLLESIAFPRTLICLVSPSTIHFRGETVSK